MANLRKFGEPIRLGVHSSAPSGSAASGVLYYDSTDGKFKAYQDGAWFNFVDVGGVTTYLDVATAQAATGADNDLCYVVATETFYRYEATGSSFTANSKSVLTTGDAGDTRWLGVAGRYFAVRQLLEGYSSDTGAITASDDYQTGIEKNAGNLAAHVADEDNPHAVVKSDIIKAGSYIVNDDVDASAAIAFSKMAALGTDFALVSDGSGHVSASAVTATELGYLDGATSSIQTQLDAKLNLTGGTMTGNIVMGASKVTTSASTFSSNEFVPKSYVDALSAGLDPKESVRAATTVALPACTYDNGTGGDGATLTGDSNGALPAQDGITLVVADRLLVWKQADAKQNGIYVVTTVGDAGNAFVLTRSEDQNGDPASEVSGGNHTYAEQGTSYQGAGFTVIGDGELTLGTDDIVWSQFSGAGQLTGGNGVLITGNTLSVELADTSSGLEFDTGKLAVDVDDTTIQVGASGLEVKEIANANVASDAAIAESKLDLDYATDTLNTAISGNASDISDHLTDYDNPHAVEKSDIIKAGSYIVNADVDASAAIVFSKMVALDTDRAVITNGSGEVIVSDVTATELGYLDGATSSIQTQLDAKAGTSLDNLTASVALNNALKPDTDNTYDFGTSSLRFKDLYALSVKSGSGDLSLSSASGKVGIVGTQVDRGTSAANSLSEKYSHNQTLASTGVVSSLTFSSSSYTGCIIEYAVVENTTGNVKIGHLYVATDGTVTSLVDNSTDTDDTDVTFSAAMSGTDVEITATLSGNACKLHADQKLLKVVS